jgi:hypothetical protein
MAETVYRVFSSSVFLDKYYAVGQIKKKKIRRACVTRGYCKVSVGRREGRDYLEELDMEG